MDDEVSTPPPPAVVELSAEAADEQRPDEVKVDASGTPFPTKEAMANAARRVAHTSEKRTELGENRLAPILNA